MSLGETLPLPHLPKVASRGSGSEVSLRAGPWRALAETMEGFWSPPEPPQLCPPLAPTWQGQALQIWGPAQNLELSPRWGQVASDGTSQKRVHTGLSFLPGDGDKDGVAPARPWRPLLARGRPWGVYGPLPCSLRSLSMDSTRQQTTGARNGPHSSCLLLPAPTWPQGPGPWSEVCKPLPQWQRWWVRRNPVWCPRGLTNRDWRLGELGQTRPRVGPPLLLMGGPGRHRWGLSNPPVGRGGSPRRPVPGAAQVSQVGLTLPLGHSAGDLTGCITGGSKP